MARMRSKRKRPEREERQLKEARKIEEGVFENRTLMRLQKLFTKGIISKLDFVIGTGKEADVYLADAGEKMRGQFVIVKIFRVETSYFRKREDYIIGDPRFRGVRISLANLVNEWCKKEYANLKIAEAAGVHAPRPYLFNGNIIAMSFIEDNGAPAPRLKDCALEDPKKVLRAILSDIKKLYKEGMVHADISEYNRLMKEGMPYLIDFGQAVLLEHPRAAEFLERDVNNIIEYFSRRYGLDANSDLELGEIVKGKKDL